jgi:2-methylcitrate dehydratase PrpD
MTRQRDTLLDAIHGLAVSDLPPEVLERARSLLLDLLGVAASGTRTELSRIVRAFTARQFGSSGSGARLLFDGRRVSPAGAAYADASTIDAFDAHDGHALTKGHAGVAVLPALIAMAEAEGLADGGEFLACLVLGYEIATRAGIALHAEACDYHTSGAWNALGCAAVAARILRLNPDKTRHALGTAEYHGPRSQMMRCIDHPTMVKDGSGWGALAGISAAYLAADGFTGAPAVTVEHERHEALWADLGSRWRILEQYVKPYPVCRWAQPAIEAAAGLMRAHLVEPDDIERVTVRSFMAAVRLGTRAPATTEEAQYAIGFPLAALLARGRVGATEIGDEGLADPATLTMLERIALDEDEAFTRRFPAERVARVEFVLRDGTVLTSPDTTAQGDPDSPFTPEQFRGKFRTLAADLGEGRIASIEEAVATLDSRAGSLPQLIEAITTPVGTGIPAIRVLAG